MEIQEIIRRWQAEDSQRKIALGTGLSRDTIAKYVAAAQEEGIVRDGLVATAEQLSRLATIGQSGPRQAVTPGQDQLEPWADQIYQWLTGDRLQLTRIRELLAARGCPVSYPSLRRFVLKRNWRRRNQTTVRMEDTAPGEVAEVDFGRLGMIVDPETGRRRAVWGLIIVLAYSRHSSVWPTHGQTLEDIIAGLEAAWVCFGGVPSIWSSTIARQRWRDQTRCIRASPEASWNTRSAAVSSPMRRGCGNLRTSPRWSVACSTSGSVSSRAAISTTGLPHLRTEAQRWCLEVAGMRIHGTTRRKPLVVFQDEERDALLPWDGEPYEIADWRNAKVHPDHHIQCQQALYSVPSDRCPPGQQVEIRLGSKLVHIYHRGQLIKTHLRQPKGGRSTDPDDYPAELSAYTTRAPDRIQRSAAALGPAVGEYAEGLFDGPLPPGPRSGRDTSCCVWASVTRRSVWTPPVVGPWPWISSTCAGWNASWCRPWNRRPCPSCPCPCRRAAPSR